MFTNKIYCFGDGYATGHIWPEWPQIIAALLPENQIINIAGIGAGAEWLVTRFCQTPSDEVRKSRVLWQWPQPHRFDKLVETSDWEEIILNDPIYYFNTLTNNNQTWWLSSASKSAAVKEYHQKFIQPMQHQQRSDNYRFLIRNTLENLSCQYHFFSTAEEEIFSQQHRFSTSRQQEVQPSPIVHFYYCVEQLLPALKLTSDNVGKLETLILNQSWQAYDPDREPIWEEIKSKLKFSI